MSVALSEAWKRRHWIPFLVFSCGVALTALNAMYIQARLYKDGMCQTVFLSSLDAHLTSEEFRTKNVITILLDPATRGWVGRRAIFDRERYKSGINRPQILFEDAVGAVNAATEDSARLLMGSRCNLSADIRNHHSR